jgi:hypothetical protein
MGFLSEQILKFSVPVALKMVMQIAVRDIGQLTDLESWPVISIWVSGDT